MKLAIQAAREGIEQDQSPFGAALVRDGQLLTVAHNTVWESGDCTAHAEIIAHNPYAGMSCRRFHRLFTRLKITRADWQVADGLR